MVIYDVLWPSDFSFVVSPRDAKEAGLEDLAVRVLPPGLTHIIYVSLLLFPSHFTLAACPAATTCPT